MRRFDISVSDGQKVNAAITNAAFVSRTVDTTAAGKVDLNNADAGVSGSSITNVQRAINSSANFVGKNTFDAYDADPSWTSDVIGTTNESVKARVDSVQAIVEGHTTDKMDKITGVDNVLPKMDTTSGAIQNSGITVDDSDNVTGVNDLTVTGDLTVNGTTTTIDTTTLDVTDPNVTYNKGGNQATADGVGGFTVEMSDATDVKMIYDSTATSRFKVGDAAGEVEIATISGAQIITNKDIDGGTMTNANRITLPQETTANLAALALKKGNIAYDTTLDSLVVNNGLAWNEVTGSGGIGFNYIINSDAETGVTGTNESANVTISQQATSPLRGTYSFQADFASIATTADYAEWTMTDLDLIDMTGDLIIRFDYSTDTNVSSGDFKVVLRNADSSVDINVTNEEIGATGNLGVGSSFVGRAQTNSALDNTYALRIYPTSNLAALKIIKLDNIIINSDKVIPGYIGTEWEAFTPTGSWTTNATYTGFKRRVGDVEEYDINIALAGAPNAASLTITIPDSKTIDTNKLSNSIAEEGVIVGTGIANDDGAAARYNLSAAYSSTTAVVIRSVGASATYAFNSLVNQTVPFTFASPDTVSIKFSVPISGWSASGMISTTENLFKNVDIRGESNGGTSITANVTDIDFTEVADDLGLWDGDSFTAKEAGLYSVSGCTYWTTNISPLLSAYIDGTVAKSLGYSSGATSGIHPFAGKIYLEADEVLTIRSSVSATLLASADRHHISISQVKDTSVFAVSGETELIDSTGAMAAYTITSNQWGDLTSISLTPGEWDLSMLISTHNNGVLGAAGNLLAGISTTSGNSATGLVYGDNEVATPLADTTSGARYNLTIPKYNVTVTSTTTYYLKALKVTPTNLEVAYKISARRIK